MNMNILNLRAVVTAPPADHNKFMELVAAEELWSEQRRFETLCEVSEAVRYELKSKFSEAFSEYVHRPYAFEDSLEDEAFEKFLLEAYRINGDFTEQHLAPFIADEDFGALVEANILLMRQKSAAEELFAFDDQAICASGVKIELTGHDYPAVAVFSNGVTLDFSAVGLELTRRAERIAERNLDAFVIDGKTVEQKIEDFLQNMTLTIA